MNRPKGVTPNAAVHSLKETLKKEHYTRVQWEQQYGKQFKDQQNENEFLSSRKDFVTSRFNESSSKPRRLHVEIDPSEVDDEGDYDESDPNLFSGYSSRFCGFYLPTEKTNTFKTTQSLEQTEKAIELEHKDNFRKKHWLKMYFEESAKMQNLFKNPGDKSAPAATKK